MSDALQAILPPLLLSAPADGVVFYRKTEPITYATFRADLVAARQALMKLNAPEIVLYDADAYAFAVWLLACWQNGQTALLVAEDLPATRTALPFPWVGRCEGSALPDWFGAAGGTSAFPGSPPQFDCAGLVVFTSGSSGAPNRIFKTPTQLYREAVLLQQIFGKDVPPETRFVGTVPHQHMFGLPFRLMWPLWAGYPIISEVYRYPEELLRLEPGQHVLISSPATLKRLAQLDAFFSPATFLAAFSAGSPLHDSVAAVCASRLATSRVVEIYGSTEAGSIMHRIAPGGIWREHPGVTLALDEHGCLKLRSPLLADEDWFFTQDTAVRDDNGWRLTGRADRVAKIEGRRVALDAIETALLALPEVAEARTAALYGERDEIVAAVVLSDSGRAQLQAVGKTRFDRWLRQGLSASLERIAIPRRWRYLSSLPCNEMGKITTAEIVRSLERQALPPFTVAARGEQEVVLTLALCDCVQAFTGHFPQLPILPGVAQIDWALRLAQRYFPVEGRFSGFRQLRFQRILSPDDKVSLTLRFSPEKKEVHFIYASAHGVHSQGRALFTHPAIVPNNAP
ncbi:MAG: AMP-binding protein [Proteobacteria bacterium]|nr:AMP-binding protein [Pseudomonadota bacterium]MCL2309151.1 AMP-binding protein [Pseudomonadota bacterium]